MTRQGALTRRMRAAGKRLTGERKLILRVIEENPHFGAAEIHQLALREHPGLNLSTVYRTMSLLRKMRLVDASSLGEDHNHFEARGDAHHHAVCLGCGLVLEMPTDGLVADIAARSGFRVSSAQIELLGYCSACQARAARTAAESREGAAP